MKKLVLLVAVVFSVGFGGSVLFSSCGNDSSADSSAAPVVEETVVEEAVEVVVDSAADSAVVAE